MDNFTHFFNTKKGILHTFLPRILATLLILFSATFAIADTETHTFTSPASAIGTASLDNPYVVSADDNSNSTVSLSYSYTTGDNFRVNKGFIKFVKGNTLTFSSRDEMITSIIVYYQNYASSNLTGKTITADNGTFTYNAGLNSNNTVDLSTWSGSSKSITISNDASNGGDLRITSIVVTTSGVTAPTFTPAAGSYSDAQTVTLASTTTGAKIYYTTDGTEPSYSNGTLYSTPISVSYSQTIKAIAYLDDTHSLYSDVTSARYVIGTQTYPYTWNFEGSSNWTTNTSSLNSSYWVANTTYNYLSGMYQYFQSINSASPLYITGATQLPETKGLTFYNSDSKTGRVGINIGNYLWMNASSIITIPSVSAGQTIVVKGYAHTSNSTTLNYTGTGLNADATALTTTPTVYSYIASGGDVTINANGGAFIQKIAVLDAYSLKLTSSSVVNATTGNIITLAPTSNEVTLKVGNTVSATLSNGTTTENYSGTVSGDGKTITFSNVTINGRETMTIAAGTWQTSEGALNNAFSANIIFKTKLTSFTVENNYPNGKYFNGDSISYKITTVPAGAITDVTTLSCYTVKNNQKGTDITTGNRYQGFKSSLNSDGTITIKAQANNADGQYYRIYFAGNDAYAADSSDSFAIYVYDKIPLKSTSPEDGASVSSPTSIVFDYSDYGSSILKTNNFQATLTRRDGTTKTWTSTSEGVTVDATYKTITFALSNGDYSVGQNTMTISAGSIQNGENNGENWWIINDNNTITFNVETTEPIISMITPSSTTDVNLATNIILKSDKYLSENKNIIGTLSGGGDTFTIRGTASGTYTSDTGTGDPYIVFINTNTLKTSTTYTLTIAENQISSNKNIATGQVYVSSPLSFSFTTTTQATGVAPYLKSWSITADDDDNTKAEHDGGIIRMEMNEGVAIAEGTRISVKPVNGSEDAFYIDYYTGELNSKATNLSKVTFEGNTVTNVKYAKDELKYDVTYKMSIPANCFYAAGGLTNTDSITFTFKVEKNSAAGNQDIINKNGGGYTWDFENMGTKTGILTTLATAVNNKATTGWQNMPKDNLYHYSDLVTNSTYFPQGLELQTQGTGGIVFDDFKGLRFSVAKGGINGTAGNDRIQISQNALGSNYLTLSGNTQYITIPNVPVGKLYIIAKVNDFFNINSGNAEFTTNCDANNKAIANKTTGDKSVFVIDVKEAGDVTFCVGSTNFYKIAVPIATKTISSVGYATEYRATSERYDLTGTFTENTLEGYYVNNNSYTTDTKSVDITKVTAAKAHTGVILKGKPGIVKIFATDVNTDAADASNNLMKGCLADSTITQKSSDGTRTNFVFTNVYYKMESDGTISEQTKGTTTPTPGFYKSASGTLKANKAYLELPNGANGAKNIVLFSFYDDGNTTGIDDIKKDNSQNDSDVYYTLSGLRITKPTQKGIYIKNGKKILVK